jgi:hypothetical protein
MTDQVDQNDLMMDEGRRQFLIRTGLLAVASIFPVPVWAQPAPMLTQPHMTDDHIIAMTLLRFVYDTFSGLLAFMVPGDDCYSVTQGVAVPGPGGALNNNLEEDLLDCKLNGNFLAMQRLIDAIDEEAPLPSSVTRVMISSLIVSLKNHPIPLPTQDATRDLMLRLDDALLRLLDGVPLTASPNGCDEVPRVGLSPSLLSAVALNLVATVVNPDSVASPSDTDNSCTTVLRTPFARLSFIEKQRVFELLDLPTNEADPILSEVLGPTVLGLFSLLGGALMSTAGLVAFSEASNLDVQTYIDTGVVDLDLSQPVTGWQLARYQMHQRDGGTLYDTVHGWDEFEGYFEGRMEATD